MYEKMRFDLKSNFTPKGSQPEAIRKLTQGILKKERFQTLLGVTGSGKTFTIANVISKVNKPVLVLAHNKTLAAQLYSEFKEFFPKNRVEFFVSYYDYYQPESYIPQKDQYIEKDAQINPKIEQMRLSATASVLSRRDTIIVSSISAIYGLGNPETYKNLGFELKAGEKITRDDILRKLVLIQYERNETELMPGRMRVRGDTIDIIPAYFNDIIRIELFGDEIERISEIDKMTGKTKDIIDYFYFFPARHYVFPEDLIEKAIAGILEELEEQLPKLDMLEAHRLRQKVNYDIEMIREVGYCKGIENYSRHFEGRKKGERPFCLLDYFPEDYLMIIDESHQTLPQAHAMYNGDRSRKKNLVDYGFRLPSAYDNRPLRFDEFEKMLNQTIFISATPGDYELKRSSQIVEQIIRPTGLVDPVVLVRPIKDQISDVRTEIGSAIKRNGRVLLTTLTKKLAEELSEFLSSEGIRTRYMHSDIDTLERTEIIRQLRLGEFDVLVGINLLREGLDIPEVSFIGILDADKEGFLRDKRSLIQTIGRAARNTDSKVVLYADTMTRSIKDALEETERRRKIQIRYNEEHGIVPKTIIKPVKEKNIDIKDTKHIPKPEIPAMIIGLEEEMKKAASDLDFEKAISLRERIKELKKRLE